MKLKKFFALWGVALGCACGIPMLVIPTNNKEHARQEKEPEFIDRFGALQCIWQNTQDPKALRQALGQLIELLKQIKAEQLPCKDLSHIYQNLPPCQGKGDDDHQTSLLLLQVWQQVHAGNFYKQVSLWSDLLQGRHDREKPISSPEVNKTRFLQAAKYHCQRAEAFLDGLLGQWNLALGANNFLAMQNLLFQLDEWLWNHRELFQSLDLDSITLSTSTQLAKQFMKIIGKLSPKIEQLPENQQTELKNKFHLIMERIKLWPTFSSWSNIIQAIEKTWLLSHKQNLPNSLHGGNSDE